MKNIILIGLVCFSCSLQSQDLIKIWQGKPGERITLNFEKFIGVRSNSLSDYNKDGIADIVLTDKDHINMFIYDGKTRDLLDSLEINVGRSLCNNEVLDRVHTIFMDIDPNNITRTAVLSRKLGKKTQGTRSDNRVVMSGGSAVLTYPCNYELIGFLDRDGDGYYPVTFENLMTGAPEIWALP